MPTDRIDMRRLRQRVRAENLAEEQADARAREILRESEQASETSEVVITYWQVLSTQNGARYTSTALMTPEAVRRYIAQETKHHRATDIEVREITQTTTERVVDVEAVLA